MKTKKILIAVALGLSFASKAQWPVILNLNTATDAPNTGVIAVNATDNNWKTNTVSITGAYVSAVHVPPVPLGGWFAPTGGSNYGWICYPHACPSATVQSVSYCLGQDHEEYYKVTVTLGAPGTYALNWTAYADNCVYKIFLNGTSATNVVYTAPTTGGSYYTRSGHTAPVSGVINTGWAAGTNTLYVHVKSGIHPTDPQGSHTGFLFRATGTYTPGSTWPQPDPKNDCCLGNLCSKPQNVLMGDYEIPLNDQKFNFSGDGEDLANTVNVGYSCGMSDIGKLNVVTISETNNTDQGSGYPGSISIYGKNMLGKQGDGVGVMGEAMNSEVGSNCTGVWGNAVGATNNIGGNFFGRYGSIYNIGVSGIAVPPSLPTTPKTYTLSYPNANIGVYGAGDPANTPKDGGAPGSNWAGWFDGDVFVAGTAYYTGMAPIASDKKFKKEITPIENASTIISKLKPSNYFLNTDNSYGLKFSSSKQFGFISQEVETVIPDLVENVHKPKIVDQNGKTIKEEVDYKALNYIGFIALLTKGMQEQQKMIEQQSLVNQDLQNQLNDQKQLISNLTQKVTGTTGVNTLGGSSDFFQMEQNEPNPFTHETTVKYTLPKNSGSAYIAVYDLTGKQIATFPITEKGSSSIIVTSEKLPAGIYIYSIISDGKALDSKRMIVAGK